MKWLAWIWGVSLVLNILVFGADWLAHRRLKYWQGKLTEAADRRVQLECEMILIDEYAKYINELVDAGDQEAIQRELDRMNDEA